MSLTFTFGSHEVDIVSEKFLRKVVQAVRRKDGMKKLDELTSEVAIAQHMKVIDIGMQYLFSESSASSLIHIITLFNKRHSE